MPCYEEKAFQTRWNEMKWSKFVGTAVSALYGAFVTTLDVNLDFYLTMKELNAKQNNFAIIIMCAINYLVKIKKPLFLKHSVVECEI